MESVGRNSLMRVSGVHESIYTKLTLTQLSVKNSYTEFHDNTTAKLVTDTKLRKSNGQTNERKWSPYRIFLYFTP